LLQRFGQGKRAYANGSFRKSRSHLRRF